MAKAVNQTFSGIHYLVSTGKKAKEVKGRLVLTDGSIQIHGDRGAGLLRELVNKKMAAHTPQLQCPRGNSGSNRNANNIKANAKAK